MGLWGQFCNDKFESGLRTFCLKDVAMGLLYGKFDHAGHETWNMERS